MVILLQMMIWHDFQGLYCRWVFCATWRAISSIVLGLYDYFYLRYCLPWASSCRRGWPLRIPPSPWQDWCRQTAWSTCPENYPVKTLIWILCLKFRCPICTVNVWNPNVWISSLSKVVLFPNSSDFGQCLKSEPFCSDFRRSVWLFSLFSSFFFTKLSQISKKFVMVWDFN